MDIRRAASASDRRRAIDYLRRKARSIEIQAARAAPAVAAQLRSLAASMQIEAEHLERAGAI
jgi:hypothetical protein